MGIIRQLETKSYEDKWEDLGREDMLAPLKYLKKDMTQENQGPGVCSYRTQKCNERF